MKRTIFASAAALALMGAPAFAQTSGTATAGATKTQQSSGASAADSKFVMDAAKGGMAEVELGKLAAMKAVNDDVKKFAQRMVDDHSKANDELKSVAANKGITLPTDIDAKDQALQDRLSKLTGQNFDRAYIQAMVNDHVKDVNEFRRESTSGRDTDIKSFAAKALPTLEEHLTMARSADKEVVGTSGRLNKTATSGK